MVFRLLVVVCLLAAWPARPESLVRTEQVEAELIADVARYTAGKPFTAALRLKMIPHWHTYWRNAGDSGLPTKVTWTLPSGWTAGEIDWPAPERLPAGPLMNFGYEGEVLLPMWLTPPPVADGSVRLGVKAEWLVCKDICIPQSAELAIELPAASGAAIASRWQGPIAGVRAALPSSSAAVPATASRSGSTLVLTLAGDVLSGKTVFFPYQDNLIDNPAPQVLSREGGQARLQVRLLEPVPGDLRRIEGIVGPLANGRFAPVAANLGDAAAALPAATAAATPAPTDALGGSIVLALTFALIGGLILNLMPCVFPVLGIKVMGFVQHAHGDRAALVRQGLAFLTGVLVSFWALAALLLLLRAGGAQLGWGFQLQSPVFVVLLATLFLAMALNLSGVFEFGTGLQSLAGSVATSRRGAMVGAFLSGVLATVIATPCTAPFLGASLGFTLSQPPRVAFLVFTAMALGMALPVVLLSFVPAWQRWLPRPGRWMETFKQVMAFPLYGTVIWLAWVLGQQLGNDAVMHLLAGLLITAFAGWVYGRYGARAVLPASAAAAALAAGGLYIAWPTGPAGPVAGPAQAKAGELPWQPYSRERLAQLRAAGTPVFIDFTAAWCISCQVNKRLALHEARVVRAFADAGVVPLKADWTRQDPAITAALAEYGRNAVPLYVYYGRGEAVPRILPEVLTPGLLLEALAATPALESARL
jgi:thiol:disulfide interchange protein DsbD